MSLRFPQRFALTLAVDFGERNLLISVFIFSVYTAVSHKSPRDRITRIDENRCPAIFAPRASHISCAKARSDDRLKMY